jgi:hypothetical protein
MIDFRTYCQGWYQIPVIYAWNDLVCEGHGVAGARADGAPTNGH